MLRLRPKSTHAICLVWVCLCQPSNAVQDNEGGVWYRDFPEPQETIDVTIEIVGTSFRASAPGLGVLRSETPQPLTSGSSDCEVAWNIVPAPSGYDIVYTISNPTSESQAPPTLRVNGQMLEDITEYLDHLFGCSFKEIDASNNQAAQSPNKQYPKNLYSPLMLVRDSRFAVGFALHYPVLEYKHQVRVKFRRQAGADSWSVRFKLETELLPDEVRTYKISARYAYPADWIHTVKAYREYFWSLYGNTPAYSQDMTPVYKVSLARRDNLSQDNPRGFKNDTRVDLYGWQTEINAILTEMKRNGFERLMVWKPSGIYLNHQQNNFPSQIMSSWLEPMIDSAGHWHRFDQAGIQLLFWWGRSAQYADVWDDPELEEFDIYNPVHHQAMMNEWQLAVARDGDGCGFDGFKQLPPWDAIVWTDQLQAIKPDAVLITEPVSTDIMHLRFPTFAQGKHLLDPHILADYLVPGREMWLQLREWDGVDHATLERALEGISWGMTIVLAKQSGISAFDLQEAIEEATSSHAALPLNPDEDAEPETPENVLRKALTLHPVGD